MQNPSFGSPNPLVRIRGRYDNESMETKTNTRFVSRKKREPRGYNHRLPDDNGGSRVAVSEYT